MDSKARFIRSIDSAFKHLGMDAIYIDRVNSPKDIRVIPRRPEQLFELGEQQLHGENPQFEIRQWEVPSPSQGDEIHIEGQKYHIVEEPMLELHRLVWVIQTLPLFN